MINLIPNEEKKKTTKIFYLRFIVVFFVTLGLVFVIVSLVILPYYLFSFTKKNAMSEKLEIQKNIPVPLLDGDTENLIKELSFKLNSIEKASEDKFVVSQKIINEILLKKMPDIKINQISYENNLLKGKIINIKGSASSRERLLLFRLAFENDVNFKQVDLPISNFIKGSNIQFDLSLIAL